MRGSPRSPSRAILLLAIVLRVNVAVTVASPLQECHPSCSNDTNVPLAFDINGNLLPRTGEHSAGGARLHHTVLSLSANQIHENNLGGLGPAAGSTQRIEIVNVASFRGQNISMHIANVMQPR